MLFLLSLSVTLAQTKLQGSVVDADSGEPLPGASIFLEEYRTGTVSDYNGQFTLTTQAVGSAELVVSMIGYVAHR